MSTTTPYLGLVLYDSTGDQSVLFSTFRAVWGGTATTSNFYKIDTGMSLINTRLTSLESGGGSQPEGTLLNGRILPSVTSNNLTVALKTFAGADPSVSDPVHVTLNGVVQAITAPLAVAMNAGTNWLNLGSDELKTLEQQLFVYLGFNATDGVVLGIARIPYAKKYSDFSVTSTNEKYARISTISNAAADDAYSVIGRFSATLSGTAGFNWSVPSFTPANLIQYPIYETDWMSWNGTITASGSMTTSSITTPNTTYQLSGDNCNLNEHIQCTLGGTASTDVLSTAPFTPAANYTATASAFWSNSGFGQGLVLFSSGTDKIDINKYNNSNFTLGALTTYFSGMYPIK